MDAYLESFLPLFVAINLPGILPLFIGLTEGIAPEARRRLIVVAGTTAFVVALLILFAGQVIFQTLGITVNDLRVGGGLILLILAITDLIFSDFKRRAPSGDGGGEAELAVVPLGIPLTIGPAAITTILISQQSFGYLPTLASPRGEPGPGHARLPLRPGPHGEAGRKRVEGRGEGGKPLPRRHRRGDDPRGDLRHDRHGGLALG